MSTQRQIVYGPSVDGLSTVFVEQEVAEELALIRRVVETATTWGDLRTALPPERFEECLESSDWQGTKPADAEPFSLDDLYGYGDGDWPAWPPTEHLRWMPEDAQALGKKLPTVLNDDILEFAPENTAAVIAALERAGFAVRRDDAAVLAAQGVAA